MRRDLGRPSVVGGCDKKLSDQESSQAAGFAVSARSPHGSQHECGNRYLYRPPTRVQLGLCELDTYGRGQGESPPPSINQISLQIGSSGGKDNGRKEQSVQSYTTTRGLISSAGTTDNAKRPARSER